MNPKWMEKLFLYFSLWGFCPQNNISPRQRKINFLFLTLHLFLVAISTLVIFNFIIRPTNDSLGSLNDVSKLTSHLLVYWLSILELNMKQRTQQKFWTILEQIDRTAISVLILDFISLN